ncbi:MAG: hypothetical protein PHC61_00510 [Chitinivibrionales bacterium]|nr:hypothetical protein [Chitinivibrionales bacterium]
MDRRYYTLIFLLSTFAAGYAYGSDITGFNNAQWGMAPDAVKSATASTAWKPLPAGNEFPANLAVSRFESTGKVAGYAATITYYFWDNKFFQATVVFDFNSLKNFDFNYNVYRSVDQYYQEIRNKTLTFVNDIYDLLRKKYGKRQPAFTGLDPRLTFKRFDTYLSDQRWNFRYHPYDYYKKIAASVYAQWKYPQTEVAFSINISAPEKQFDYSLSLSSIDLAAAVNAAKDSLRMQGL